MLRRVSPIYLICSNRVRDMRRALLLMYVPLSGRGWWSFFPIWQIIRRTVLRIVRFLHDAAAMYTRTPLWKLEHAFYLVFCALKARVDRTSNWKKKTWCLTYFQMIWSLNGFNIIQRFLRSTVWCIFSLILKYKCEMGSIWSPRFLVRCPLLLVYHKVPF